MLVNLKHRLPMPIKNFGFSLLDWKYRNNPLIPPLKMRRVIEQTTNYTKDHTKEIRSYLIARPNSRVLDVGCGCGRLAYSLLQYSDFRGLYEGFDILPEFITWLKDNVTVNHPNFHFSHADIFNGDYNPNGKLSAATFKFPYPNSYFDSAFLLSVFSHMLPEGIENYMAELSRVLKPTAYCFISWFFMPQKGWSNSGEGYEVLTLASPEAAIAYPRRYVTELYEQHGFEYLTDLKYGPQLGHIVSRRHLN